MVIPTALTGKADVPGVALAASSEPARCIPGRPLAGAERQERRAQNRKGSSGDAALD